MLTCSGISCYRSPGFCLASLGCNLLHKLLFNRARAVRYILTWRKELQASWVSWIIVRMQACICSSQYRIMPGLLLKYHLFLFPWMLPALQSQLYKNDLHATFHLKKHVTALKASRRMSRLSYWPKAHTAWIAGALDRQTSVGLASLGLPGFQMYPGGNGAAGLSTGTSISNTQSSHAFWLVKWTSCMQLLQNGNRQSHLAVEFFWWSKLCLPAM